MIKSLQIRNYAIIESLEIRFSDGLTIITGETGAGKSILMGALGLIMGERADIKSLYNLEEKCVVEATFDVPRYNLQSFFAEHDIDYDDELVIRREITPAGKSRAFVNDTPANLKILQQLSGALIDLHQQFDTLDIHEVSFQMRMIDALANNRKLLEEYQAIFQRYQTDQRTLAALQRKNANAAKEMDFLQFQLTEFSEAELIDGEQEEMEEELARLSNAEEIKKSLGDAYRFLCEDEQAVVNQLEDIGQSLQQLGKVDAGIGRLHERFNGLILELQELGSEFETIAEQTEYDGERILEIQQRLDNIYRLQNKHSVTTVEELLAIQASLEQQLGAFEDTSADIERLEATLRTAEQELDRLGEDLRRKRLAVVPDFEEQVRKMMAQLAMENARLQIEFTPLDVPGPTGKDEVNYRFAANKGSRMQLIKDVASGGELSRLTLVTKSLVASAIPLPTLIFDEIDTGISGDVALKMGNILRKLSNHHQVVTITHSPQVAAKADAHYFVYKIDKEDRTIAKVRQLTQDERVRAIATMLSQNPPSDSALENARELLSLV